MSAVVTYCQYGKCQLLLEGLGPTAHMLIRHWWAYFSKPPNPQRAQQAGR